MSLVENEAVDFGGPVMISARDENTGAVLWFLFADRAEYELAKTNGEPLNTAVPEHEHVGLLPAWVKDRAGMTGRFTDVELGTMFDPPARVGRGTSAPAAGAGAPVGQTRERPL